VVFEDITAEDLNNAAFDLPFIKTTLCDYSEECRRSRYLKPSPKQYTLERVELSYREWVAANTYIVLRKRNFDIYNPLRILKEEYFGVKASKRGNDVYARRLKDRFKEFECGGYLDTPVTVGSGREMKTRAVFITLTYNPNRGVSGFQAWESLGVDFNKFMSRVRKKYGRVSILRGWEAFENGFPHIHAILLFHDMLFHTFVSVNKKGREVLRIHSKQAFTPFWHSFIDIQGMKTAREGYYYVQKYIKKTYGNDLYAQSDKATRTKALLWYFKKRSFAVSGEFVDGLRKYQSRLDTSMHNSNLLLDVGIYEDASFLYMGCIEMPSTTLKWYVPLGDGAG
jgi:hypothetical protein